MNVLRGALALRNALSGIHFASECNYPPATAMTHTTRAERSRQEIDRHLSLGCSETSSRWAVPKQLCRRSSRFWFWFFDNTRQLREIIAISKNQEIAKPFLVCSMFEIAIISRYCIVLSKNQNQKSLMRVVNSDNKYDVSVITFVDNNIFVFTSVSS